MRDLIMVARAGCGMCHDILERELAPLIERYPGHVSAHFAWDQTVETVNARKRVTHVPLFVVEHDGVEEFRFTGRLTTDELEEIVTCDAEALTLDDVLGVAP